MQKYSIRKATPDDTFEIWSAHVKSIREICSQFYSPEQIEKWSGFSFKHEHWLHEMTNNCVYVLEIEKRVEGFGHLIFSTMEKNPGAEIAGLYFSPKAKGLGAGKELVKILEREAKEKKFNKIVLCSTKNAKGFYEKMGFEAKSAEKLIQIRGINLETYSMEKFLQ